MEDYGSYGTRDIAALAEERDRLREQVRALHKANGRLRERWDEALNDGERFRQEARDLRAERDRLRDRADNRTTERDEAWALLKAEIPHLYGRESAEDLPHDSEYVTALHDVLDAMRRIAAVTGASYQDDAAGRCSGHTTTDYGVPIRCAGPAGHVGDCRVTTDGDA